LADAYHVPVLADEALEALDLAPGKSIIDATLGGAGHASRIAAALGPTGLLIGIDQDSDAIAEAQKTLAGVENGARICLVQKRFDKLAEAVADAGVENVDGVLFDLGVSSHQLDESGRGFTFRSSDAPLDMRMSRDGSGPSAADILNTTPENELTRIFRDYSDEKWASRISKFIVERRAKELYKTSGQLVDTINAAVPAAARAADTINPATRVFQALRIAVNDEFEALETALAESVKLLASGGRLVAISYHSGEDRIVKRFLADKSGRRQCICPPRQPICTCGSGEVGVLELLARKPISPSADEIARNSRARSAKMRFARKR
jgi:16S rRNA (cytosine1402-N4)-methyltransferase